MTGGQTLCAGLERLGVTHIFGIPGTQNIAFFEALRLSSIRTILPTHELAAGFMANGYYRSSGKVGVLTTIPGPGFAFTVAAIAEAAQDSAALLYIVGTPAAVNGKKFNLQAIDQRAILGPLVKCIVEVSQPREIRSGLCEAFAATTSGEPGPVMLHINEQVIPQEVPRQSELQTDPDATLPPLPDPAALQRETLERVVRRLLAAKRPVVFAGQGANASNGQLRTLAELLPAPVTATRSARGILPEDHPLAMTFDNSATGLRGLNSLLDASDLILAVGCKLSHNGTHGFKAHFPKEKLIHVDSCPEVLNANYPADLAVCMDAGVFLRELLGLLSGGKRPQTAWTPEQYASAKRAGMPDGNIAEPIVHGVVPPNPGGFFATLRNALPKNSCLVTDSGAHQVLATRHFRVQAVRGMIVPSDFQSMGFGLPAAIGAKLANPDKTVVALLGDGGLLMSGMEMATAVRENIPLTVIVFNDGALGQIRAQQLSSYGHNHATRLLTPDLSLFAQSIGANYVCLDGDAENLLRSAFSYSGVTLVEVLVGDSAAMKIQQAKGIGRQMARRLLKPSLLRWLKHNLRG